MRTPLADFQSFVRRKMADAMTPWVEKYRPKTVDDVSQQQQVISTLKGAIKSGSLPHLLFYGPPGTGKTTTILALARNLYGSHLSKRVRRCGCRRAPLVRE